MRDKDLYDSLGLGSPQSDNLIPGSLRATRGNVVGPGVSLSHCGQFGEVAFSRIHLTTPVTLL